MFRLKEIPEREYERLSGLNPRLIYRAGKFAFRNEVRANAASQHQAEQLSRKNSARQIRQSNADLIWIIVAMQADMIICRCWQIMPD
jgi:hypothetical protein